MQFEEVVEPSPAVLDLAKKIGAVSIDLVQWDRSLLINGSVVAGGLIKLIARW